MKTAYVCCYFYECNLQMKGTLCGKPLYKHNAANVWLYKTLHRVIQVVYLIKFECCMNRAVPAKVWSMV